MIFKITFSQDVSFSRQVVCPNFIVSLFWKLLFLNYYFMGFFCLNKHENGEKRKMDIFGWHFKKLETLEMLHNFKSKNFL